MHLSVATFHPFGYARRLEDLLHRLIKHTRNITSLDWSVPSSNITEISANSTDLSAPVYQVAPTGGQWSVLTLWISPVYELPLRGRAAYQYFTRTESHKTSQMLGQEFQPTMWGLPFPSSCIPARTGLDNITCPVTSIRIQWLSIVRNKCPMHNSRNMGWCMFL